MEKLMKSQVQRKIFLKISFYYYFVSYNCLLFRIFLGERFGNFTQVFKQFFVLNQDMNTRYFYKDIFNFTSIVVKKILFVLVIFIPLLICIRQFYCICSETLDFYCKKFLSAMIAFASFGILFDSFLNITYKGYFLPNISDVLEIV